MKKKIQQIYSFYSLKYKQILLQKKHIMDNIIQYNHQITSLNNSFEKEYDQHKKDGKMIGILNNYREYIEKKKLEIKNLILTLENQISAIDANIEKLYKQKTAIKKILQKIEQKEQNSYNNKREKITQESIITNFLHNNLSL